MSDTMITPYSSLKNILNGVSFGEYRKLDALNFHSLKDFCTNPLRWKEGYFEKERKETPAMKFGTQAHELLLQGEEVFHKNNALLEPPVNPKTGEPYGTATSSLENSFWSWTTREYRYLEQLAFYQIAVQYVCKGEIPPVYIAAIETGGQFRSAVRLISEDVMKMARRYVYKMIDSYMEAESLDQYNGPDDELGVIEYYHFSKQLDEEDEE